MPRRPWLAASWVTGMCGAAALSDLKRDPEQGTGKTLCSFRRHSARSWEERSRTMTR